MSEHNGHSLSGSTINQQVCGMVSSVADELKRSGSNMVGRVDDVLTSVGASIRSFATAIDEHRPPQQGLAETADTVSRSLKASAEYLSDNGLEKIGSDLTEIIRRRPLSALCVGVGIGALIGAALSRK